MAVSRLLTGALAALMDAHDGVQVQVSLGSAAAAHSVDGVRGPSDAEPPLPLAQSIPAVLPGVVTLIWSSWRACPAGME
jgi:hypothetical protein